MGEDMATNMFTLSGSLQSIRQATKPDGIVLIEGLQPVAGGFLFRGWVHGQPGTVVNAHTTAGVLRGIEEHLKALKKPFDLQRYLVVTAESKSDTEPA
jgi:hypothetical protein